MPGVFGEMMVNHGAGVIEFRESDASIQSPLTLSHFQPEDGSTHWKFGPTGSGAFDSSW